MAINKILLTQALTNLQALANAAKDGEEMIDIGGFSDIRERPLRIVVECIEPRPIKLDSRAGEAWRRCGKRRGGRGR